MPGVRNSRASMLLRQERAGIAPLAIPSDKLKAVAADKQ